MTVWVYIIPLHLGKIEDIGISFSNEYFSTDKRGNAKLISFATVERNSYLENNLTLRLAIDSINEIPQNFKKCILAQEDRTFYSNPLGINIRGLGRAFLGGSGGGSGICQQTIKNIFFTSKENPNGISNFNRKLAEVLLTINFSRNYSRDDILRTYLNNIYFATTSEGDLYGLKLASQYHFNKKLRDLTLGECAVLTLFVNNPSMKNRELIRKKRNRLLKDMRRQNLIRNTEYRKAISESIYFVRNVKLIDEDDKIKTEKGFIMQAKNEKDQILKKLGISKREGLKIYTTLNGHLQQAIQDVYYQVNRNWKDSIRIATKRRGKDTVVVDNLQCAVFCVDKRTGAVIGLLDGRVDFSRNWNNYCFTRKQAGSIFKVFDYYVLFQNHPDYNFNTLVPDRMLEGRKYPAGHTDNTDVSIRRAISISSNIVPFNLVYTNRITITQIQNVASLFGIRVQNPANMGTLIGIDDVSLAQIVDVYNTVSNEGVKREFFYIYKITDRNDKVLYERTHMEQGRELFLDINACFNLKKCFNGVINQGGTADVFRGNKKVQLNNIDFGGKTGTTDNSSNLWYVGYTPEITMGIWQGYSYSNNRQAGRAGRDCAMLWSQIISVYNDK